MTTTRNPSVVLDGLSFTWPDGTRVLDGITAAFSSGRTGLLGVNGTGKTTLLRLIVGELTPTAGTITRAGHVAYLPQNLALRTASTVADLLGVRGKLDALRAIESGDADRGTSTRSAMRGTLTPAPVSSSTASDSAAWTSTERSALCPAVRPC